MTSLDTPPQPPGGLCDEPVILASGSRIRREMLEGAGLTVEVQPAAVDEDAVKLSLRAEGAPAADLALALAELKAEKVSRRTGPALVIGADQVLEFEGETFDKPVDMAAAAETLRRLSGKTHRLISAAAVATDGGRIWSEHAMVELRMRSLSDAFIERYLAAAGEEILSSVGGYQLESLGAQLFHEIKGDYFTVLGLPLLPLLGFLRERGVAPR